MKSDAIRKKFLDYFQNHGHTIVDSSSLLPPDDPSVLLTTAGMQQFKSYFAGRKDPLKDFGSSRLASSQRCFRTSDIESVGDASHLTFFEMLGNFSFGDYFKKEAITFGFSFLTDTLKLEIKKLRGTYFAGEGDLPADTEALEYLRASLPDTAITANGKSDNWWGPTGSSGPCGPSAEIHYQLREEPCERGSACIPGCPCGRYLEIWNLVFTEYSQSENGELTKLPAKNIDTGMGLERLALVVQGVETVYDTDLYSPLMKQLAHDPNFGVSDPIDQIKRMRIVADHIKGVYFLLADGAVFSNKEQGYILRRIFRRACDQFLLPHFDLAEYLPTIRDMYSGTYPQLVDKEGTCREKIAHEQNAYKKILQTHVDEVIAKHLRHAVVPVDATSSVPSQRPLAPEDAFQLYSTYGISPERLYRAGYTFPLAEFEHQVKQHQEMSRAGSNKKFGGHGLHDLSGDAVSEVDRSRITRLHTATHILHQALRTVLGDHVRQQGSDITAERLRFDFEHPAKLTPEQLSEVENLANNVVKQNLPVTHEKLPLEKALESGALSFFKEKYPPEVTVYSIGSYSKEICGGPHVSRSSEVGTIKITSEKSSSAGIRRIKAVVA